MMLSLLHKKSIIRSIVLTMSSSIPEANLFKPLANQMEKLPKAEVITQNDLDVYFIGIIKTVYR